MHTTLFSGLFTLALGASIAMPAGAQEVLPFPLKPSGSVAGKTMQQSTYTPLSAVNHLPKDAPNILIVLIDDVGPGSDRHVRRRDPHADADPDREGGDLIQPVSHHGDVFAHARRIADWAQPAPSRERPDRRAGERLGRIHRDHPEEQRHDGRGAQGLRL